MLSSLRHSNALAATTGWAHDGPCKLFKRARKSDLGKREFSAKQISLTRFPHPEAEKYLE
jgi:hypothetical protein